MFAKPAYCDAGMPLGMRFIAYTAFFVNRCSRISESSVFPCPSALPILSEEASIAGPVTSGVAEPWSPIFSSRF